MGQFADVKQVSVGTSPVQLIPMRPEREVAWIYNAGGILYYKFGLGASETSFTGRLTPNESSPPLYRYNGPITAVKASGTSMVYVTECW